MVNILSYVLFAFAISTLFLGGNIWINGEHKKPENLIYCALCLNSSMWSFCWSMLIAQTNTEVAYVWRCVGMISVFAYLILSCILLVYWFDIKGAFRTYMIAFSCIGALLYPFNIQRSAIHMKRIWFGMAYEFDANFWTNAYTIYSVIIAVNIALALVYGYRHTSRTYHKILVKRILISELGIFIGMLLDTIFPLFGFGAFPGSSLGQAVCIIIMYPILCFSNRSQISYKNFPQYAAYATDYPILIIDTTGNLKLANHNACTFFHIGSDEIESLHISQLYDIKPSSIPESDHAIMHIEIPCNINNRFCGLNFSKIQDEYGDLLGFIVTVIDLTDKQQMIKQLMDAKNNAEQANEAKSSFLAKMSHEIRTPINAILGMDELLLRETTDPSLRKYALDIRSASRSLLSIINDILDFSKIESGKMELIEDTYHIGTLIHDLQNVLSIKAEDKGLKLNVTLAADIPCELYGDEVRIRQIITNILNNAIKYTDKGSITMTIDWEPISGPQPDWELGYARLHVTISDTGIGIKKEDIGKLFDAFQRLDEHKNKKIEGTGLGLSIVQRFIELMNGTIQVESEYGKGSTFSFCVTQKIMNNKQVGSLNQIKTKDDTQEQNVQLTAPEACVLVVDDNRVNIAVLKGLLKRTKVQIDSALSGAECLKKVQEKHYDLIYLDHMMPEMDGLETLDQMKQLENNKSKDAFVVALTANAIVGVKEMYLTHGFHAYLSKPIESDKLEKMLFEHIPKEYIREEQLS